MAGSDPAAASLAESVRGKPPQKPRIVIAIDGPAAAGKGTLAKRLSQHYRLPYLDTGLLYRGIGKLASDRGVDLDDPVATGEIARALEPEHLDEPPDRKIVV